MKGEQETTGRGASQVECVSKSPGVSPGEQVHRPMKNGIHSVFGARSVLWGIVRAVGRGQWMTRPL